MVKERREAYRAGLPVSEHLHIGAVAVPVQDEIVDHKHFVNGRGPAVPNTEIEGRFTDHSLSLIVSIQCDLRFSRLFEVV